MYPIEDRNAACFLPPYKEAPFANASSAKKLKGLFDEVAYFCNQPLVPLPAAKVGSGATWRVTRRLRNFDAVLDEEATYTVDAISDRKISLRVTRTRHLAKDTAQPGQSARRCSSCLDRASGSLQVALPSLSLQGSIRSLTTRTAPGKGAKPLEMVIRQTTSWSQASIPPEKPASAPRPSTAAPPRARTGSSARPALRHDGRQGRKAR